MRILILLCFFLTGCSSNETYQAPQAAVAQANAEILKAREKTKQVKAETGKIKIKCQSDCKGLDVEIPTSGFSDQSEQGQLLAMPKAPKTMVDVLDTTIKTALNIVDKNTGVFAISSVAVEGFKALKDSGETNTTTTITDTKTTDNSKRTDIVSTIDLSKHDSDNDSSKHDSDNDYSQREENNDSKNDFSQREENHDSKNDNSEHDRHDSVIYEVDPDNGTSP